MSLFSVQARKHTAYYDHLMSTSRTSGGRGRPAERKTSDTTLEKSGTTSGESACEDSRTSEKSRQVNRTYVVSALSKSGGGQQTPHRGRLTLQRRSRRRTGGEAGEKTGSESSLNSTPAPEKRLTLQRRTRTPSMDKSALGQRGLSGAGVQPQPTVLSEPNGRTPSFYRSASVRQAASRSKSRETHVETQGRLAASKTPSSSCPSTRQLEDKAQTCNTPTKKTPFEKIAAKRDVFEKLAGRVVPKVVAVKSASLERPKSRMQQAQESRPAPAPRVGKPSAGVHRPNPVLQVIRTSSSNQRGDVTQARTSPPAPPPAPAPAPTSTEQPRSRPSETVKQQDSLKMEDSAVTVAVRVRPFSAR